MEIELTKGFVAIVDECDYEMLSRYSWRVKKCSGDTFRAISTIDSKTVYMHRLIMGVINSKTEVDHVDHNGLNNTRKNLRLATMQQNQFNKRKKKNCSSVYKGVSLLIVPRSGKKYKYWVAEIMDNGKSIHLGNFKSEVEAAIAYNKAAINIQGEFAVLNTVPFDAPFIYNKSIHQIQIQ